MQIFIVATSIIVTAAGAHQVIFVASAFFVVATKLTLAQ